MKKGFFIVMIAQALSSLADNALFIAAIALIAELQGPVWLTPVMKWFFALAYVLLAAFVGAFADSFPKGRVMFITNSIKILGCMLMFIYGFFDHSSQMHSYIVCLAYGIVGIGAAAYSPAKYGIVTELLPPKDLVKGNSWIEGLTVISIILGTVLGAWLIRPENAAWLQSIPLINALSHSQAEAVIVCIGFIYLAAALCNLLIPDTHFKYPKQETNPIKLSFIFIDYVKILWKDKVGQISLAVTTLFWGAGATLQLVVLEWGREHLGISISDAGNLMGISALGTVIGAVLASRIKLERALTVLPVGILMGLAVLLMPFAKAGWEVYGVITLIGALAGFFVVPMNAILQHRGHVLLSAGHSIAVQNFNEQLNILFMVGVYTILLQFELHINTIIMIFGSVVAVLMTLIMLLSRHNEKHYPAAFEEIGDTSFGRLQESSS